MNITRTATVSLGLLLATAACSTTSTISSDAGVRGLPAGRQSESGPTIDDGSGSTSDISDPSTTSPAPRVPIAPTAPTTPEPVDPTPTSAAPVITPSIDAPTASAPSTTALSTTAPSTSSAPADEPSAAPGEPDDGVGDDEGIATVRAQLVLALTAATTTVPPRQIVTDLTLAAPSCGYIGTVPDDAQGVESALIDVDDDGLDDEVTSYFAALGDSTGWRLRLDLADGPLDDIAIEGVGAVGAARILGGVQVDFDLADPATHERELLVQAGANAAGVNIAVFGIDADGCLFRYEDDQGADLVLPVHDAIGVKSGVMCDDIDGTAFLARLEAEHDTGSTYDASYTPLQRTGAALVPGTTLDDGIDADKQTGWLNQFGNVNCGGIEL